MLDTGTGTDDRNVSSVFERTDPHAYPRAVVAGEIVVNANILTACRRHLHDLEREDLYFDVEEWEAYLDLIADLKITGGHELTGKPFELLPWQAWVIGSTCWRRKENGGRRYSSMFIEVARGAGKTSLMATLMLHIAAYTERAECAMLANTVEQAGQAYRTASVFARDAWGNHKDKENGEDAKWETTERELRCRASQGRIFTKSARSSTLDGLKAMAYLIDESAEMTSDWMKKIISALPKALDSFLVSVTTPGGQELGRDSPYYSRRLGATAALEEKNWDDLDIFAALYGLEDDDDMLDEATWIKAQPSLDHVIPTSSYRRLLKEYQVQGKLADWERFQCCRFTTRSMTWVAQDLWDENVGEPAEYPGRDTKVFCSVDFSKSFDLSSMCWGWWEDEKFNLRWHHWAIRKEAADRKRDYQRHLEVWDTYDNVTVCNHSVQYSSIRNKLRDLKAHSELVKVGYDALGGMKLSVQDWEDELRMTPFPQSIVSMGPSTYLFESLIRDRRLNMQACPVVSYALSCVQLEENINGDRRISKSRSAGVVDPIVAATMVMGILIQEGADRPGAYSGGTEIAF